MFAKVDGEQFTAFLSSAARPGLTIGPEEHKLGIRGSSTCPLFLEDCAIPIDEPCWATIGQGHKIAFNILNIGRWKLGIGAVGGAKYCLELGVKFARERKQFGKPIAEFDLIRKKLGEHRDPDLRGRVDGVPHRGPAGRARRRRSTRGPAGAEEA